MENKVDKGVDNFAESGASSKLCDVFQELKLHDIDDRFIFIEACAGRGILSSVAKEQGFSVVPVDCPRNQRKTKVRVITLDLTSPHAADYLLRRLVKDYRVIAVHFGLPCGTCSKARGILMADGSPGPQPLRDFSHLHGRPGLSDRDRLKVEASNDLYRWADSFIQLLDELGIAWTVEKPSELMVVGVTELAFALAHGTLPAFLCVRRNSSSWNVSAMDLTRLKAGAMTAALVSSILPRKLNILEAYACNMFVPCNS